MSKILLAMPECYEITSRMPKGVRMMWYTMMDLDDMRRLSQTNRLFRKEIPEYWDRTLGKMIQNIEEWRDIMTLVGDEIKANKSMARVVIPVKIQKNLYITGSCGSTCKCAMCSNGFHDYPYLVADRTVIRVMRDLARWENTSPYMQHEWSDWGTNGGAICWRCMPKVSDFSSHSESKVPHSESKVPHSGSKVPHSGSEVPHSESEVPHSGMDALYEGLLISLDSKAKFPWENVWGNGVAIGNYAHAEGVNTIAIGMSAHAEGYAMGGGNIAIGHGYGAHAEGYANHVEGVDGKN